MNDARTGRRSARPAERPVGGDSHAHLLAPLEQHAAALGFEVRLEPLDDRDSYCSARDARIVVGSSLPANARVATLVHELTRAHGVDYKTYSRAEAELIVESVHRLRQGRPRHPRRERPLPGRLER